MRFLIIGTGVAFLISLLLDSVMPQGGGVGMDGLLTLVFLIYIWYTIRWAISSKKHRRDSESKPTDETEKRSHSQPGPREASGDQEQEELLRHVREKIGALNQQTHQEQDFPVVPPPVKSADPLHEVSSGPPSESDEALPPHPRPVPQPKEKRGQSRPPQKESGYHLPAHHLLDTLRGHPVTVIHHKSPWAIVERGATIGRFRNVPIYSWIKTSDDREADYDGIADDPSLEGTVCIEIPERSELILPPGLIYLLRT